ncbi:MAG: ribonuclease III domain-containing protein [Candidatus Izemoplasmatales bacterium]|nr:ribonuclease III domain-containing protein [Candidatus Izemoplasmatales bacterium]MDD4069289.1 ribonuclease III domain-containing protein [Candidatus Izemoplasmatales bacterium]
MILYNGLTLAYIGDAYFEMRIRNLGLSSGLTLVNDLHNFSIKYTNSKSQALAAHILYEEVYTEEEKKIFKRGRNQNASHKPKNSDVQTYNKSTGFEAVIGYLYLEENWNRLDYIFNKTIEIVDKNSDS